MFFSTVSIPDVYVGKLGREGIVSNRAIWPRSGRVKRLAQDKNLKKVERTQVAFL
jgi:hypothetical protein